MSVVRRMKIQNEVVAALGAVALTAAGYAAQPAAEAGRTAEMPRAVLELPPGPGNTRNSEGDFMLLKDGRILFAYSKFIGGRGDDHDQCVIAARTSADKGESWSGDRIVATNELAAGGNVMSVSLLRLRDGRIALFYGCKLTTPEGLMYSVKLMRASSDEGGTWGPAKDITAGFPKSYRVLNNARVIRLKSGRILVPMADHGAFGTPDRPFSNHARMVCCYSDDDGASWKTSACVDRGAAEAEKGATFQEPGVVELKDGCVLMYFRTNLKRQYYAYSSDGGATWGAAVPSPLMSPLSPATIRRLGTGELVAFWNDHENRPDLAAGGPGWASGVRTPLTVGLSADEGRTWPWRRRLETGYDPKAPMRYWYCYTAVLELDDRLLVAYCAEKNLQHLRITSIPLSWLKSEGADPGEVRLRPSAFRLLKPGSVQAERWLRHQLELQRDGLTGHAEEIYNDIGHSDWLTGEKRGGQYAWERGPYYLKGLVALAWTLDDAKLQAQARRWIEAILASQRENGDFGPRDDNWWANMIVLHLMRDYYEATEDARALAFLERYFGYQREKLKTKPFRAESIWADRRGGDELEVVLWLCGRPGGEKWLDFARLVASQTLQTVDNGRQTNGSGHIVNFMQALKTPALKWRLGAEGGPLDSYWDVFGPRGREFLAYGRPDRMLNGSETLSDIRTSEGTELCAIVERILSNRTLVEVSGDARIADDLESVAYNALPATLPPDLRGTRYYNILNQVCCDVKRGRIMQANGAGSATCPGPEAGFGCCRSNWHFGWPKFVSALWMAAGDGLAAVAYGPCRVKAPAGDGVVEIHEETDYPFRERIRFTVVACTATKAFDLRLRLPAWCCGAKLAVNGEARPAGASAAFTVLNREWKAGDRVELVLPMSTVVRNGWSRNASSVHRGPLLFAHALPYEREVIEEKVPGYPKLRLLPKEVWGRALVVPGANFRWKVEERPIAEQPFDPATPPVVIVAGSSPCTAAGWGTTSSDPGDTGRVVEPPWYVPNRPTADQVEPYTLQPVGATELRISLFPTTGIKP